MQVSRGDEAAAEKRLALLDGIELLRITDKVAEFATALVAGGGVPEAAGADAVHVAVAAVNGIHYLLTWNCAHIANAKRFEAIQAICIEHGYKSPILCTPDELIGD